MKKLVLFMFAWVSLTGFGFVSAQVVQPEAQALIDKAIVAHGGRAAIEGIRTMVRLEVGRVLKTDGSLDYTEGWREIQDFEGRRYRTENWSGGTIFAVDQGTSMQNQNWAWDSGVTSPKYVIVDSLKTNFLKLLVGPIRSASLLGPRTVHGVSGQAFTMMLPDNSDSFSFLLGADGTVLAMATDTDFLATGTAALLDDHRVVNGVLTYFHYRSFNGERLRLDYQAKEVQVNGALSDAMFVFPPPPVPAGRVGVQYEAMQGKGLEVTEVIKGAAADQAGVKLGDLITEVNGISVLNVDDLQVIGLRGEPGTVVVLTIKRGDQILKITVTRALI
jgi:membrane-associated protease RseP (regulator of RpoE activity)